MSDACRRAGARVALVACVIACVACRDTVYVGDAPDVPASGADANGGPEGEGEMKDRPEDGGGARTPPAPMFDAGGNQGEHNGGDASGHQDRDAEPECRTWLDCDPDEDCMDGECG